MAYPIATSTGVLSRSEQAEMASLPAFLSEVEKRRLARIKAARQLYNGQWRQFLLTGRRTAHLFKAIRSASGEERPLLVTVNILGLAARKTADLLMLDPPGIVAREELPYQQEAIEAVNQASHIEPVLYEGALSATYEAEAWMQVMRLDGQTIIANVATDMCFPLGEQNPDGSYDDVAKMWLESRGDGRAKRLFLRKEIHSAGLIRNELFGLSAYGNIEGRIDLPALYGPEAPPEQYETGVDEPLLDFVPNFMLAGQCISDFDGVEELVDQFTAAVSQTAGVIAKHADPKLGLPEDLFDEQGQFKATDDAFAFRTKDEIPQYLTWNAQLDAAIKMIELWLKWLLVIIEMSPSLLGLREGAAPDAYKKLRLEAFNTLAKVGRKKLYWHRFVRDLYRRAAKLDNATPGRRYDYDEVAVQWHDGIPLDESETTDVVAGQKAAGLVDRRTAVEEVHGPQRAEQINERLDEEDKARRNELMNLTERQLPNVTGTEGERT